MAISKAVSRSHLAVGLAVWIACGLYLALRANQHWIPHDEGTIGQAALRTLEGQLPHRDFDELYSGGLTFLHAAAFELLGVRLTSLRWVLLAFSLLFIPALYKLAARAAPPAIAALVTLAAVSWTLPNYFASMPSWYNLFFAVFGTLAFERYLDRGQRRWLVAAGACAGASFTVKSVGLYFLAAGLLFLIHDEQEHTRERGAAGSPRTYRGFVIAGLALFAGGVVTLLGRRAAPMEVLHYALPPIALVSYLVWNETRLGAKGAPERFSRLLRNGAAYLAGASAVVLCFVSPFMVSGSMRALIDGVLVAPQKRLQFAFDPLPPPWTLVAAVPLAALAMVSLKPRSWRGGWWPVAIVVPALGAVLAFSHDTPVYRAVWFSARPAMPLVVIAMLWRLSWGADLPRRQRQTMFLISAVAALVGLVQFPLSFGLYFCFAAAPIVLAWLVLATSPEGTPSVPRPLRVLQLAFLAFYAAFPVLSIHRADFRQAGIEYRPITADARLALPRAGLDVQRGWVEIYEPLVAEIQRHSSPGSAIYAFPDAPEVYFLAERTNPTRTFFDFFSEDPARRAVRLAAALDRYDVDVVVLNGAAHFSAPVSPAMQRMVEERYPAQRRIGPFTVAWRGPRETRP